ncbi:MAG: RidA family protein [Chitinophagaceae bacterium]
MKKEIKHPDKLVSTGAYSAGVMIDDWLFVSGQGPLDLLTGEVVRGTIEEETTLTLLHVKKIVEAAGGTMTDIVKCTVHLTDINEFDRYNAVYASFFSGVLPARTTVQSVLCDGIKVEIDAIAKINSSRNKQSADGK